MNMKLLAAVAATALTATGASAQVYNTSLQNINGPFGTSTATTSTNATGTRTVVTGPGPNAQANRAVGTATLNSWYQNNVGAGTTMGITTNYARSGNGSAYFSQTQSDTGKADLQYYFGSGGVVAPVALSTLTSFSYDFYRDALSSASNSTLAPVLRLDILKDGVFAGSLIWENAYQAGGPPPAVATNTWLTGAGNLTTGVFWTNNALLGPTNATTGGTKTLAQWIADNTGSTLSVYGVNIGFGSGWQDNFYGAVDNVSVNFSGGRSVVANFEVAPTATGVPEPATWGMMIAGFGLVGGTMRRRKAVVRFA